MRVGLRTSLLLLVLLGVACPAAAAPLEGVVEWQGAVASGAVAPVPAAVPSSFHYADLADPDGAVAVLWSDHVEAIVHTWEYIDALDRHQVRNRDPATSQSRELHNVTVTLLQLTNQSQMYARREGAADDTSAPGFTGATCTIGTPQAARPLRFPDSPTVRRDTDWVEEAQGRHRLGAACHFDVAAPSAPMVVFFYGVRVRIDSAEGVETIETGRWEPAQAPTLVGLGQSPSTTYVGMVTQILEIRRIDRPLDFQPPAGGAVRFFAAQIAMAGHLRVDSARGQLAWGGQVLQELEQGWQADGAFRLTPADERRVEIRGETWSAPPAARPSTPATSAAGPAVWGAASAIAGLAGWIVWTLLRVAREDVLVHPRRHAIYEFVHKEPGAEVATVARRLGLRETKVAYHLRRLERAAKIVVRRVGGRTAVFPANAGFRGVEARYALLRRPSVRQLYEQLAREPGLDQFTLAARLGLTRSQVSRNLGRLEATKLLITIRTEARRCYVVQPLAPTPAAPALAPSAPPPAALT